MTQSDKNNIVAPTVCLRFRPCTSVHQTYLQAVYMHNPQLMTEPTKEVTSYDFFTRTKKKKKGGRGGGRAEQWRPESYTITISSDVQQQQKKGVGGGGEGGQNNGSITYDNSGRQSS